MSERAIRVLLIEDNPGDARLIRELLAESARPEFDLRSCDRLSAALQCLQLEPVDVILLDLSLPDSSGLDTFHKLHTRVPHIPIVVLTGLEDEVLATNTVHGGAQDYLLKGQVNSVSLVNAMRYAIERARTQEALRASEERYRELFENARDAVYSVDVDGRLTSFNREAERITGYARAEALGMNVLQLLAPEHHELSVRIFRTRGGFEPSGRFEVNILAKSGRRRLLELSMRRISANGKAAGWHGIARDITEQNRAQVLERDRRLVVELVAKNQPLPTVLANLIQLLQNQFPGLMCAVWLLRGRRLYLGASANLPQPLMSSADPGLTVNTIPTSSAAAERYGSEDGNGVDSGHPAAEGLLGACREQAIRNGLQTCWAVPVFAASGGVLGILSMYDRENRVPRREERDLLEMASQLAAVAIEQRQLSHQLVFQAQHDSLTKLPNRFLLADRLQHAVDNAHRRGEMLAVLYIDLDRFKLVNDTLGHTFGDRLLLQVARRLETCVRRNDTLARVGGDEFMLVVTEVKDQHAPITVAQKILAALQRPFRIEKQELFTTASIGISVYPRDGQQAAMLQRNADAAMYRAKNSGAGGFRCFAPEMTAAASERLELETLVRGALERQELSLRYQPQFCLRTGALIGFEALLRWNHPRLGQVPPGRFIPVLEETGLIVPITGWVLEQACHQSREWQKLGRAAVRMAVNVSTLWFCRPEFYELVANTLGRAGLQPRLLDLEITETLIMRDLESSARQMAKLRSLGLSISVDDFGTGYSSLSYLQRLPLNTIKIDQSFVSEIKGKSHTSQLVRAVVDLGHSLGLSVTAEGVETQAQLAALKEMGCDEAQGYLLGQPELAEAAERVMRRRSNCERALGHSLPVEGFMPDIGWAQRSCLKT